MKSILYILVLVLVMSSLPNSIGVSTVANGQTIGVNVSNIESIYIKSAPSSVQMYYYIKKYAEVYEVPLTVAFKIGKLETGYRSPLDFKYDHRQISSKNAFGGMQILLSTGRYVSNDPELTREVLLNDLELNVKYAIKYMRQLYNIYHDWSIVAGYYNSGYPQLNEYALQVKSVLASAN